MLQYKKNNPECTKRNYEVHLNALSYALFLNEVYIAIN